MSFEFLVQKKKAIEDVMTAFRALQKALRELPWEWQAEVLNELNSLFENEDEEDEEIPSQEDQNEEQSDQGEQVPEDKENYPENEQSTAIVLRFIKANPGTKPGTIAAILEDRIVTKSKDPKTIVYTTISYLKRKGIIRKETDGGYYAND